VDTTSEAESQVAGAGSPTSALVRDIILHAGAWVDFQLPRVNKATQPLVIFARILTIGIAKRIVNVLLGSIDAKAFFGDLELLGGVAMRQEREHPNLKGVSALACAGRWAVVPSSMAPPVTHKNPDGRGIDTLQAADVNSLGVVSQPVAKVDTGDHGRSPFLAAQECKRRKDVLDIYMRCCQ